MSLSLEITLAFIMIFLISAIVFSGKVRFAALGTIIAFGAVALGMKVVRAVNDANSAYAIEHAGHEEMHANFAVELNKVERGDLVVMGKEVYMVTNIGRASTNDPSKSLIRYREPACFLCAGEPNGWEVEKFAKYHAKPVYAGTPEYTEVLGKYFAAQFSR